MEYDKDNNEGVMSFTFLDSDLDLFVNCSDFRSRSFLLGMIFSDSDLQVLNKAGITDNVIATTCDPKFNQNNTSTTDWYEGLEILTIELTFEVDDTAILQYGAVSDLRK